MPGQGSLGGKRCRYCQGDRCSYCYLDRAKKPITNFSKQKEPQKLPLALPANIEYIYDGSLSGFYCCLFESVYNHELPLRIEKIENEQPSLLPKKFIPTEDDKAQRVAKSIVTRISLESAQMVEDIFLTCMEEKEISLLRFLIFSYETGRKSLYMLGHPLVAPLWQARKHMMGEIQLLMGFIRFSDFGEVMAAVITPKNFVLPYLASHFIGRFERENFMIFDKTHKAALIYENGIKQFISIDNISFPETPQEETRYQELWKQFYRTIAIESRENPRCRMTHMPKRYWENMTEVQEYL